MFIYAIRDQIFGFMSPFTRQNDDLAIRDFKDALSDKSQKNVFTEHPEDFKLYRLGKYNQDSGIIESDVTLLFSGLEVS